MRNTNACAVQANVTSNSNISIFAAIIYSCNFIEIRDKITLNLTSFLAFDSNLTSLCDEASSNQNAKVDKINNDFKLRVIHCNKGNIDTLRMLRHC